MRLPKVELRQFNGNVLEWLSFWDNFSSMVHAQDLSKDQKMTYLMSALTGKAKLAEEATPISAANYDLVVETLRRRFGDTDMIRYKLFEKLILLPAAKGSLSHVRQTFAELVLLLRQLESLGENLNHNIISTHIWLKLPKWLWKLTMEERKKHPKKYGASRLREHIQELLAVREVAEDCEQGRTEYKREHPRERERRSNVYVMSKPGQKMNEGKSFPNCAFCSKPHWSADRKAVKEIEKRLNIAREKQLCLRCLKGGHNKERCRYTKTCFHCRGSHHTALYRLEKTATVNDVLTGAERKENETLLLTQKVTVRGPGTVSNALAFFDVGSEETFITNALAKKLNLPPQAIEKMRVVSFGENSSVVDTKKYTLTLEIENGERIPLRVYSLEKLTNELRVPVMGANDEIRRFIYKKPDLLIGADYFFQIILMNAKENEQGFKEIHTEVGRILEGSNGITVATEQEKSPDTESRLTEELRNFWRLESIGIEDCPNEIDDDIALRQFETTVQRKENRYEVGWPWKTKKPVLASNFSLALGRLKSVLKRLGTDARLFSQYDEQIKEQLRKGIIERVSPTKRDGQVIHYIPHHPVLTPQKTTTKLRIVYDASAKTRSEGKSLNDCLYRGPLILPELGGMLLRFRQKEIIVIADVEKVFHQIELREEDRDSVRFLWVENPHEEVTARTVSHFRFTRIPFGVISSPFLLASTIRFHLNQEQTETAKKIRDNIYADNVLISEDTPEKAIITGTEAKALFQKAGMNLREFISSDNKVNKQLAENEVSEHQKFLGIYWNIGTDTLQISWPEVQIIKRTRRAMLKAVASIYDPMGMIAPAVMKLKKLHQNLCSKYGWDEVVEDKEWKAWKENWQANEDEVIELPRRVIISSQSSYQLHAFADASTQAYACAIYIREHNGKGISTHLIWSKNRINPIKPVTIPRLELMAALIASRALGFVTRELHLPIEKSFLWTDSMCVYGWLKGKEEQILPKFVENRIREIKNVPAVIRYVNTLENPADLSTRGCTTKELRSHRLRWKGPTWLTDSENTWTNILPRERSLQYQ